MKDLKLLSPAAAAASACISTNISSLLLVKCVYISYYSILEQSMQKIYVITADAAAAATLRLTLVPSTNLSLKLAASVRPSLARSRPSAIY